MAATDTNLVLVLRPAALLRDLAARLSAPVDAGDVRARRDFVLEMTARNPDAFSSDLDVLAMMLHDPGHFQ